MILITKTSDQRDKGDTLSLLVQFLFKLRVPCAPPPASLLISNLLDRHFLFYISSSFHQSLPPWRLILALLSLFFAIPDPTLVPVPFVYAHI